MQVNKLLSRVVAPENFTYRRGSMTSGERANQIIASNLHNYTFGITSDPLTQLAVVFGALIHDVDHWGVSNAQLRKEGAPMADKYGNQSIAEQNSVDRAWDLLLDKEEFGDLQAVIFPTEAEYKRFRQVVVNVVMATDIFDKELNELRKNRWAKAFHENAADDPESENRKATIVIEHVSYKTITFSLTSEADKFSDHASLRRGTFNATLVSIPKMESKIVRRTVQRVPQGQNGSKPSRFLVPRRN